MLMLMGILLAIIDLKVIGLFCVHHAALLPKIRICSNIAYISPRVDIVTECLILNGILLLVGVFAPDPVTASILLIYGVSIILKFAFLKVADMPEEK
jgi:hypothetical protein